MAAAVNGFAPAAMAADDADAARIHLQARRAAARPAIRPTAFKGHPSLLQEQWWRWVSRLESDQQHFPELTIQVLLAFPDASIARVENAIRNVIARHDSLRYRFLTEDGALRVQLNAVEDFQILRHRIEDMAPDDIAAWRRNFFAQPVPASGCWLAKAAVLAHSGGVDALMVINHIVADATSNRMIEAEIQRLVLNPGDEDRPLPRQYAEYVNWEREWLTNSGAPLVQYWRHWRGREVALLSPSTGRALQWAPGPKQSCKSFLPSSWAGEIRKTASRLRTTPFLVYLTALAIAVARWSRCGHFLMRNIGDGRWQNSALLPMVGLLTVADPIEANIAPDGDFERTLRNLEAEYRASLGLRLPDIHAFSPGFGASGIDAGDMANNFAVNINYMPSGERSQSAGADLPDPAQEPWPPRIIRAAPENRLYSVSPIHLFVTEGKQSVVVDFKMHTGLLDQDDQDAVILGFFECLKSLLSPD